MPVEQRVERQIGVRVAWLAWGGIAAQVLFVLGILVLGAVEGRGYSAGRHDISDLGALTARHPDAMRAVEGTAGVLTVAFAIGALRPTLSVDGGGEPVGAWLVALSLLATDELGDVFFRLDCRAADAGCSMARATTSASGKAHVAVFVLAAIASIAAPFALAHRMEALRAWRTCARPTRVFGAGFVVGLAVALLASGTGLQGWTQRALILYSCSGLVLLAAAVLRRAP